MDATNPLSVANQNPPRVLLTPRKILWLTVAIIWLAWEFVALSGILLRDVFPSTFQVLRVLFSFLGTREFYGHAGTTFVEIIAGFVFGSVVGIGLGIVMGVLQPVGRATEPYISGLMATPRIVWFPVALMLFGSGIASKAALGALGAFFPTVLYAYAGMLAVRPIHKKVAAAFRTSAFGMVTKVYLPSLRRPILVGSQIALGVTITPVLLAEMKSSSSGLGHLVMEYYNNFQISQMYAVLTFVFVLILIMNVLLGWLIDRENGSSISHVRDRSR